jgi:hypothetical protein
LEALKPPHCFNIEVHIQAQDPSLRTDILDRVTKRISDLRLLRISDQGDLERLALPNGRANSQIPLEQVYALIARNSFGITDLSGRESLGHQLKAQLLKGYLV